MSVAGCKSLNLKAAAVHTALLVGFVALFEKQLPANRASITLYRHAIDGDNLDMETNGEADQPQKSVTSNKVNIKLLVYAFFGVTAAAHLLYATDFFGRGWYTAALERGWNPFRWIEYGISASIMAAIIAPFSGVRDSNAVLLITGTTAAMQGTGFLVERALTAQGEPDTTAAVGATVIGWLLLVVAWTAILRTFFQTLRDVNDLGLTVNGQPFTLPAWLWGIGVVQMVFFSSFGLVQLSHMRGVANASAKGVTYNFAGTEKMYLVLSLAAKATLASVLAYGLVARNEE
jgi:hypothetical protein